MRGGGRITSLGGAAGLVYVQADKDGDGDFDALTAVAWEDSTKSGSGTINLNTVFGVPTNAKVAYLWIYMYDTAVGRAVGLKAKSTTTKDAIGLRTQVSNVGMYAQGNIPIAADGTIYYSFPVAVDHFWIRVVGWYI